MVDQQTLQNSTVLRKHESGQRQGTSADWAALNPILGRGELGYATDTGELRHGDGSTPWLSLPTPGSGAFAQKWQATHAYTAGDLVVSPNGQLVSAIATFTSGASYSASNWTIVDVVNYAPIGRLGSSMLSPVVFAGDSITDNGLAIGGAAALGAYPTGQGTSGTVPSNAGVAGNTSAQLLARFDTDVIAKSPKLVHILIGTNDAGTSVSVATFAANIKAMVAKCKAIGARIVFGTIPPNGTGSPSDRKAKIVAMNQWLCRYALQQGIQVADYYRVLVDTTTGGYQTAYDSGDATHPSPAGFNVMLTELQAAVARPASASLLLPKDANDPWNYVVNGLYLSSWATGWTRNDASTGVTLSTTSGDANVQGNWGKIAAVSSSGTADLSQNRSTSPNGTAYAVGNWFTQVLRMSSTALTAAQTWKLRCRFFGGGDMYAGKITNIVAATAAGGLVFTTEGVSPASSTLIQPGVQLTTGTGDISVAQWGIYDLTAMGVTDTAGNLV